jgi:hypothetical protein
LRQAFKIAARTPGTGGLLSVALDLGRGQGGQAGEEEGREGLEKMTTRTTFGNAEGIEKSGRKMQVWRR